MSTPSTLPSIRQLWKRAWALSPALTVGTVLMLIGAGLTTAGLLLDPRQLLGEPLWLKPTKFYVSLAIYDATLLYFLAFLPDRRRLASIAGTIVTAVGGFEMVAITLQAARGVRSHFNVGTAFDRAVHASMGIAITVLWVTMLVLGIALLRARIANRPLGSALRAGLVAAVVGMGLGYFMTAPRSEQLALVEAGQKVSEMGAHTFGAADGGPGLPVVGWSTIAGDMRPAHFLGLHGMQVLPLVAAILSRRRRLSEPQRLAAVRGAGVAYVGLVGALALQALRGLPLIRWDAIGAASLALVALASLATFALTLARRRELAIAAA